MMNPARVPVQNQFNHEANPCCYRTLLLYYRRGIRRRVHDEEDDGVHNPQSCTTAKAQSTQNYFVDIPDNTISTATDDDDDDASPSAEPLVFS